MTSTQHQPRSPEGRHLAKLLNEAQRTASLLIDKTYAARSWPTNQNHLLTDAEREIYIHERESTLRQAAPLLMAMAGAMLGMMQEEENATLVEAIRRKVKNHEDNPVRLTKEIATAIARS